MCGRFTQMFSWQEIHDLLSLEGPPLELRPRYNMAPGQNVSAVRLEQDARRLALLRWGLIPGWADDPAVAYRLINARAETAASKPSFRGAFRSRRCLIPTNGFYEWRRAGGVRQPFLIGRGDGGLLAFAGLWERWTVPPGLTLTGSLAARQPGEIVETCAILTTAANEAVAPVHNRMPVILSPDTFEPWLRGERMPLGPCDPEALAVRPVSTVVNNARNDDPRCIEPPAAS